MFGETIVVKHTHYCNYKDYDYRKDSCFERIGTYFHNSIFLQYITEYRNMKCIRYFREEFYL